MSRHVHEWEIPKTRTEVKDQEQREVVSLSTNSLGTTVVRPGDAISEDRNQGSIYLLAGVHAGFTLKKSGTRVTGPGARIGRQVVIDGDGPYYLDGLTFVSLEGGNTVTTALVDIKSTTATVWFTNCRFQKQTTDSCLYVSIASGAKVHFVAPRFEPAGMPAGTVVTNAGVAADVIITNSSNITGQPHANVTTFGETN